MKATAPRRQIFTDAVDLLTGSEETAIASGITTLDIDSIRPFHDHRFRLYEGERLEDMIQSIKAHGVLTPVIVRKTDTGYEMLSGHNRTNAAKLAGLTQVPAVIKENLTDEESYIYVIETNLMQRGFTDMLPSEKAAVLASRYEKISSQGKRTDIIREIQLLNGIEPEDTSGHCDQKLTGREAVAKEYGLSSKSVARLLRVNELIEPFKAMLDQETLPLLAAIEISFLPFNMQGFIYDAAEKYSLRLNQNVAKRFRSEGEDLTEQRIEEIAEELAGGKIHTAVFKSVKLPTTIYQKYFSDIEPKQAEDIIAKALESYFTTAE